MLARQLETACSNVLLITGSDGQKIKREKLEELKASSQESIMRFENADLAGELLEAALEG